MLHFCREPIFINADGATYSCRQALFLWGTTPHNLSVMILRILRYRGGSSLPTRPSPVRGYTGVDTFMARDLSTSPMVPKSGIEPLTFRL